MSFARSVRARRPVPAWRPLAGLIRSLSAFGRDSSQCCRSRFLSPDRHRSCSPNAWLEVDRMLADRLDYVIGVDPHRDRHALAIVEMRSGGVIVEASVDADARGYATVLLLANEHAPGRRAFAVEGAGSYGAGLTRFLSARAETVFEVGRLRRERRAGGKTDAIDAVRAAKAVLAQERPAVPRANGKREALRALMAAREGAVAAKTAALSQLRDLLVTAPEPLRSELRPLTRTRLLDHLTTRRPDRRRDPELRGTQLALKALARRIRQLATEERELAHEIE